METRDTDRGRGPATAIVSTLATRWLTPPPSHAVLRFTIPPSPNINQAFQSLAWSPDGSRLVYLTSANQGERQLMLRTMDDLDAHPIAGASGQVSSPAFSPDGQFVAFFSGAEGVLKKISIAGGVAITLCKMVAPYSGPSWHPSGIVFAQTSGVMRVSADGGEPELIVKLGDGERIAAPQLIDDRGTLLFSYTSEALLSAGWDKGQVDRPERRRRTTGHRRRQRRSLFAVWSHPLHVGVDAHGRAVRCGCPSRARKPSPGRRGDRARDEPAVRRALRGVDVRSAGLRRGCPVRGGRRRTLALVDMNGKAQPLAAPPNAYLHPRVSPDGMRVAVATDDGKEDAIWTYDLSGNSVPKRLTFEGRNSAPIWSPDSQSITFQSDRDGRVGLFRQRADGSTIAERLTTAEPMRLHFPESWSRDGKTLTFRIASDALSSIWTWSSDGDRTPKLLIEGAPAAGNSELSPDGRWLAYGSNELNRGGFQVFVQPFPPTGAKFQVNAMTASTPVWSRDGKRLFFAYNSRIFSAAIQTTPAFAAGQPVEIKMPNIMANLPKCGISISCRTVSISWSYCPQTPIPRSRPRRRSTSC